MLLLQQQERAVGLPHREGLHEGDGGLRLSGLQLGEAEEPGQEKIFILDEIVSKS